MDKVPKIYGDVMKGILIYSGGLDSTCLLYDYKDKIDIAITYDYDSKHSKKEIECAKFHCEQLNREHLIIDLKNIFSHFKSSLLKNGEDILTGAYDENNIKKTVVPFRNGILLSIAVGIAESKGLNSVYIANHNGDHAIYPDCTDLFIKSISETVKIGTHTQINIISPYCTLSKREIAKIGQENNVDFSKTYSCYNGGELHCGECSTCIERKEALKEFDTTKYKK